MSAKSVEHLKQEATVMDEKTHERCCRNGSRRFPIRHPHDIGNRARGIKPEIPTPYRIRDDSKRLPIHHPHITQGRFGDYEAS